MRTVIGAARRVPLAARFIARDAARFVITIAGVGMTVVLVLFLLALNAGVREEGNGWIATRPVDAWVAQRNTTNFIKASSLVRESEGDSLRAHPAVVSATPILRLITLVEHRDRRVTAIVVGLDSASADGRPHVVAGTDRPRGGQIILDRALARRLGTAIGDTVRIEGRHFTVVGLSRGTNAILTQYAFVSLADARPISPVPGMTSFFLVRGAPGMGATELVRRLREHDRGTSILAQADFAENNMEEMRGGMIAVIAAVAVLGGIVAMIVLALLLHGSVMERREDYALLKALGASASTLAGVVVAQAMAAVAGGMIAGLAAYVVAAPVARHFAPAVPLDLSWHTVLVVGAGALVVGALGATLPIRGIARIHPADVFRP